ncbi:hypothetical protein GGR56DRAFT_435416 [Xylariaceae sp. FL0804]|nr:hypothetical protein GGR56DRAFT_435416 [Xylariaceae sp. FL0804]
MSRLSQYVDFLETALRGLDGQLDPTDQDHGRLGQYVPLPLARAPPIDKVHRFYNKRCHEIRKLRLDDERRRWYTRCVRRIARAYRAIETDQPRTCTVEELRKPLMHLSRALAHMAALKDYDEAHPLQRHELCNAEPVKWQEYKLTSLQPGLVLLVYILEGILPDCRDLWNECEEVLHLPSWVRQFVLDSYASQRSNYFASQRKKMREFAPKRADIARPSAARPGTRS